MKAVVEQLQPDTRELMRSVLRDGAPLAPEYPLVFQREGSECFVSLREDGEVRSSCAILERHFLVGELKIAVGLIGSVSTHPDHRGRGLGTQLLAAAEEELARRGCSLAMLWSPEPTFYFDRGYAPVGMQLDFVIPFAEREVIEEIEGVRKATAEDGEAIHRLYEGHRSRVQRTADETAMLLECPDMEVLVAETEGEVVAYACRGRGADMRGVVHEWGGPAEPVLGLLRAHLESEGGDGCAFLAPASSSEVVRALLGLEIAPARNNLGIAKVLDPVALGRLLERSIAPRGSIEIVERASGEVETRLVGPRGEGELNDEMVLTLLFPAYGLCDGHEQLAAGFGLEMPGLPVDLFAWGLDSI